MKIAVFPGSFDPITLGHVDVIERALPMFDKIIIAIGSNASKKYMFDLKQRTQWIKNTFAEEKKIEVEHYNGLTVDYCKSKNAQFILRGLRNTTDFEFEKAIAQTNKKLNPEVETIFLLTSSGLSSISSSIVRDVMRHNGDYSGLVPKHIKA